MKRFSIYPWGTKSKRRGAAVVEMAVISPILITLIFGVIEFGWAFMVRQMVTNGAREGARTAAIQTVADDAEIRQAVIDALASVPNLEVLDEDIEITHWCLEGDGSANFAETVTITVEYSDISLLGDYFSWIDFNDLVGTSSMRKEGVTADSTPPGDGYCAS